MLILVLIFQKRRRAASFTEVLVVTLASFLILGITAVVLLLDLYARGAPWQLTITQLLTLAILSYFTVLVMNAVRKKELMPRKQRLIFLVILATSIVARVLLYYPWNPAYVIVAILVVLLVAVAIIRDLIRTSGVMVVFRLLSMLVSTFGGALN